MLFLEARFCNDFHSSARCRRQPPAAEPGPRAQHPRQGPELPSRLCDLGLLPEPAGPARDLGRGTRRARSGPRARLHPGRAPRSGHETRVPEGRGRVLGGDAEERGLTFGHVLVDGPLDLREAPLQVVAARGAAAASGSCGHTGRVRPRGPARPPLPPPPQAPRLPPRPAPRGPHLPWPARGWRAPRRRRTEEAAAAQLPQEHLSLAAAASAGEGFFSLFKMAPNARRPAQ